MAAVLFGPKALTDWFWFLRPVSDAPWTVRLLWTGGPWLLPLSGALRVKNARDGEYGPDRSVVLAAVLAPFLLSILWFFRDRVRTAGDGALFTWAMDLGAPLRVPHAPLTQVILDRCGRTIAYLLGMPVPDGVALCIAAAAAAFAPVLFAVLRPLPRGKRWFHAWAIAGSSLAVLAFGQIEIYLLPAALEILFLYSLWVWLISGSNWWVPVLVFPLMLLSGLWNAIFSPVFVWAFLRLWRTEPERRGLLLSLAYGGVGVVVLFYAVNAPLLHETWSTLLNRVTAPDFLLIAGGGAHAAFLGSGQFWGLLNVVLAILAPAIPLLGTVRGMDARRLEPRAALWFPLAALASAVPLALVWNPWFGYERDANLFSFLAPPLLLCVGIFFHQSRLAVMPRRSWTALFLLGFLPAGGASADRCGLWTGECWRGPLVRVEAWLRPDALAARPRALLMAGDPDGAVRAVNLIHERAPLLRKNIVEFLDVENIERLESAGQYAGDDGWAQDLIIWTPARTVLIVDAWGRLFVRDGEGLRMLELRYPVPAINEPVAAMTRGPHGELYLLYRDGTVIHGHQAVNEPLGSWTWRPMPRPAGIANAWPKDEAVDLAYDFENNCILILDYFGGVHVAGGATLLPHPEPDFDRAVSLIRIEDGWCVVTARGGCYPVIAEPLGFGPEIIGGTRFDSPIFVDAYVEANGRGRVLLDVTGVPHPVAEAGYFHPFYPGKNAPRFRRLDVDPETGALALLDAMYNVAWVNPDSDGVLVLHRIAGAGDGDAAAVLQLANRTWRHYEAVRPRMLELIVENPSVLKVARLDPQWMQRLGAAVEP